MDKDRDKSKAFDASALDTPKFKDVQFGPKAQASHSAEAKTEGKAEPKGGGLAFKAADVPKLRIVRGDDNLNKDAFKAARESAKVVAGASMSASASVEASVSASASIGASAGSSAEIGNDELMEAVKEELGGKTPSFAAVAEIVLKKLGIDPEKLEDEKEAERALMIQEIAAKLQAQFRVEKGAEIRAGVSAGASMQASSDGSVRASASLAGEIMASGGAVMGGLASLAGGSAQAMGAAAKSLGRFLSGPPSEKTPGAGLDRVTVLPTISEYRVGKIEQATNSYEKAMTDFWKLEPMSALRSEIDKRARQSGLSVPDAMEKMKPGGEWSDLHDKFVQAVADSPDALQAKVAMDSALKSFIRQVGNGREELLSADVDENPAQRRAKERIEASEDKMQELTKMSPLFGGESQSHSQRLREVLDKIMERLRELVASMREKVMGVSHATP